MNPEEAKPYANLPWRHRYGWPALACVFVHLSVATAWLSERFDNLASWAEGKTSSHKATLWYRHRFPEKAP